MFRCTCCAPPGSACDSQIDSFPPSHPVDGSLDGGLDDSTLDALAAEGSEFESCANRVQVSSLASMRSRSELDDTSMVSALPEPEPELPEPDDEREPCDDAEAADDAAELIGQKVSLRDRVSVNEVPAKGSTTEGPSIVSEEAPAEIKPANSQRLAFIDRQPSDIVVKVGRRAKHLGLEIESPFPTSLTVLRVNEGAIMSWNRLNPDIAIRHGYSIVKVNNCEPIAAVLEERLLKEPVPLYITFRTPLEWQATLWKYAGAKIGLEVALSADTSLIIRQVKDGIVQEYNNANPESSVVVCDRIISVNGIDDDPRKILTALGKDERLDIVFSRSNV